jgi:16S rRNA (adenine1518-N6/adenine1519-N6)-dimethyltransferase
MMCVSERKENRRARSILSPPTAIESTFRISGFRRLFPHRVELAATVRYIDTSLRSAARVFRPKKSLGQNFLRDENVLRKIVESLDLRSGDVVVEIGTGQGALTKHLINHPITFTGIELDGRAIELLKQSVGDAVDLVQSDVLDVRLQDLSIKHGKMLRVVGNIPYYLTSQILFWLFDSRAVLIDATLMMQLEVARRITARPKRKEYGILSVFSQFYADCKLLFKVSRNCFFPRPEVDSAVVRLNFKRTLPECDEKLFRSVVRSTFGTRRKTLRNGLRSMGFEDHTLEHIPFDLTKRPEELGIADFVLLGNALTEVSNHRT